MFVGLFRKPEVICLDLTAGRGDLERGTPPGDGELGISSQQPPRAQPPLDDGDCLRVWPKSSGTPSPGTCQPRLVLWEAFHRRAVGSLAVA